MNYFTLFAYGEQFDVDAYLGTTVLQPDHVWRRGESQPVRGGVHPTSGVEFTIGDGLNVPFPEQQRLAVAYLQANREALEDLASRPGVTNLTLGLQYHLRHVSGLMAFAMAPSRALMRHALDIGIAPVFHVSFERPIELADDDEEDAS
jgi:hypothetical protein